MIKSMTGYGIANFENDQYIISVEIKTLNSKFMDMSIRSPRQFLDKEMEIRNIVTERLERGKVNLSIDFVLKEASDLPVMINEDLFVNYYHKYLSLAQKVGGGETEIFKLALQSPNVSTSKQERNSDVEDWEAVKKVILEATEECDRFRKDEGNVLLGKLEENIQVISDGLARIVLEEPIRKERIKNRIRNNFQEWMEENGFDENRFEQELIYYFEKLDITEEIVRLGTHLDYFSKNLREGKAQGKKLGFIGQELGREINTIGSKANDAQIQRDVIIMKDELEKIKEQSLNIL